MPVPGVKRYVSFTWLDGFAFRFPRGGELDDEMRATSRTASCGCTPRRVRAGQVPNGISGGHFYQHYEQGVPPFVETTCLCSDQNKGDGEYLRVNNLPTLVWFGQLADIELHTWYSRVDRPSPLSEAAFEFPSNLVT